MARWSFRGTEAKRVVVETRLGDPSRPMAPDVLRQLVRPAYLDDDTVHAIVIVSASEPGSYLLDREQQRLGRAGKSFTYINWTGPMHNQSLRQAIKAQLQA